MSYFLFRQSSAKKDGAALLKNSNYFVEQLTVLRLILPILKRMYDDLLNRGVEPVSASEKFLRERQQGR